MCQTKLLCKFSEYLLLIQLQQIYRKLPNLESAYLIKILSTDLCFLILEGFFLQQKDSVIQLFDLILKRCHFSIFSVSARFVVQNFQFNLFATAKYKMERIRQFGTVHPLSRQNTHLWPENEVLGSVPGLVCHRCDSDQCKCKAQPIHRFDRG